MKVAAVTTLVVKTWFCLSIASLASARYATTTPQDLSEYYPKWKMSLVIDPTETTPSGSQYDVEPMTLQAGFQQTDVSKLMDISGNLVLLDHTNYTDINYMDRVIYLSCDWNATDPNMIKPDLILNTIMNSTIAPAAIILYSTTKAFCYVGGEDFTFNRIWSMISTGDAVTLHTIIADATTNPVASIMPSAKSLESQQPRPGSSSAVAMSILYTITGLITLLFLLIITTGAVRAHRNPERYGPRASTNGRPRRSRARGLAMAMLETLPIVKFGEPDERKPDEETALDNLSGVMSQQQHATRGETEGTSSHATEPSTDAVGQTNPQHTSDSTAVPTGSTSRQARNEPQSGDDHLGCSICTEDFTVGEDVRVLPCNHKFHPACVDPWLVNVSGTCPLCRLDLRPPEDIEREESSAAATRSPEATTAAAGSSPTLIAPAPTPESAPEPATEPAVTREASNRRRRSRLLDWNRLRHASVDERLQALRQYRQTQQSSDPTSSGAEDEPLHSRLAGRLRRFHIRSDTRSSTAPPENTNPPTSTGEH